MPPRPQRPVPSPEEEPSRIVKTLFYTITTSTGQYVELNFLNGSVDYFGDKIRNGYKNILIDNVGGGQIRISLRPDLIMTSSITGAKTIESGGSLFIEDDINYIRFYFVASSTIELVGIYE